MFLGTRWDAWWGKLLEPELGVRWGWEIRSTAFAVASVQVQRVTVALPIYIVDKPSQFRHSMLCLLTSLCCGLHLVTFFDGYQCYYYS